MTMRKKAIYPYEWVLCHPYDHADAVDNYYAALADKVFHAIEASDIALAFEADREVVKDVAIRLTMYFEDLASEIGVWRAATAEFRKRYGSPVPFFEVDGEYEEGFVNREDLQFLLWNEEQSWQRDEVFLNPEDPAVAEAAKKIYGIFDQEWETAPSNVRLHDVVHNEAVLDSYWNARNLIEWFHDDAFVCTNSWYDLGEAEDELEDVRNSDLSLYSFKIEDAFKHKHNMLSISVPQWIGRIRRQEERDIWEHIKWKSISFYECLREEGERLCLHDLISDEDLMVEKDSFNEDFLRKELRMHDVLYCSLVSFKSEWFQCGQLLRLPEKTATLQEEIDKLRGINENLNAQHIMYEKFMKLSKGEKMLFFGSVDALNAAYEKMGSKGVDDTSQLQFERNCVMMCSPVNGITLLFDQAACICADGNPFYDKEIAKKEAHQFYLLPDIIEYREACDLHEGNFLPDAKINSLKGDAYGTWFLHKHGQFIIDYFFSQTREYDYDAKYELMRWMSLEDE